MRRWLLALLAALHAGCATLEPQVPPAPAPATLGRVAVVAGTDAPDLGFQGLVGGEAAGAGAGTTFLTCASVLASGSCSGWLCAPVVTVALGVCGVAAVVGGVAGASAAPSAAEVRAAESRLRTTIEVNTVQEAIRRHVEAAARARGLEPVARADADTLLETTLTRAGVAQPGVNVPVEAQMSVRVRLLRAADGAERYRAEYLHLGDRLPVADWSAQDGAQLIRTLDKGYAALAAHVVDNVFLLHPFPSQDFTWAGALAPAFGLAPIEPALRGSLTGDRLVGDRFEWTLADTLQPVMRWQAFPRAADVAAAPADMSRVRNVTYELVIAREQNLAAAGVVYRRAGLIAPEHRLEAPLTPDTRYFWTVRARFELDGTARVTGWGATHHVARDRVTAPSRYSYRFRTP